MISRLALDKLLDLSRHFPVVSIVGPRQAGKSTLSKMAFPDYHYVSLENPATLARALDDPLTFLRHFSDGVIIDEAQKAPELFSYLQEIVDTSGVMGKFILTGSQNFLLLTTISQSLAGRVGILQLLPLSLSEIPDAHSTLNEYLWHGMYPPIYDRKVSPLDWYPSYIQTYLERDVRNLVNIHDLSTFQRFLKLCAGRIGQLINLTDLANDCGISRNTAKSWLSVLEASFVLYFLHPYHANFTKRMVKQSKLYFFDTGLAASLLDVHKPEDLDAHYLRGAFFENFVISEIHKSFSHRGIRPQLYFWRDHSGHEIDLLIESGSTLHAIELKSGLTITKDHLKHLLYFQKIFHDKKTLSSSLIYAGDETYPWSTINVKGWKSLTHWNLNAEH